MKSKIKDIGLSSFRLYNKRDHRFENWSKEEYKTFQYLKNNENIIVQKTHKGNSVVIIGCISYIAKMEELLNDRSNFMKVQFSSKDKVNHNLAKLSVPLLKQYVINEYTVKDSFPFCKEIVD